VGEVVSMVAYLIDGCVFCESCSWDAAEEWPNGGRDCYGDLIFTPVLADDLRGGEVCSCCGEEV